MKIAKTVGMAVLMVLGASAMGCAAESTGSGSSDPSTGWTVQAVVGRDCTQPYWFSDPVCLQKNAAVVADAIMAGDTHGICAGYDGVNCTAANYSTWNPACAPLISDLQTLEADMAFAANHNPPLDSTWAGLTNQGLFTVNGLPAVVYSIADAWHTNILSQIAADSDTCFTPGTSAYVGASVDPTRQSALAGLYGMILLDPPPANLTQNMAGSTGSSASAVYSDNTPTTAFAFPSTYTKNNVGATAGLGCDSHGQGLPAGSWTSQGIATASSYAKCF